MLCIFVICVCKYESAACTHVLILLCDCGNTWKIDLIQQFGRSLRNANNAYRSTVSTYCSRCGARSGTTSTSKGGRSRWNKSLQINSMSVLLRFGPYLTWWVVFICITPFVRGCELQAHANKLAWSALLNTFFENHFITVRRERTIGPLQRLRLQQLARYVNTRIVYFACSHLSPFILLLQFSCVICNQ